jgi:undecaprenyl-diphosphatase
VGRYPFREAYGVGLVNFIQTIDRAIVLFLNQFAGKSELIDRACGVLTSGPYLISSMLFVGVIWWCWFRKADAERETERRNLVSELSGVTVAGLLSRGIQLIMHYHPRPLHDPTLSFSIPFGVDPALLNHWSSFPSDHAAVYFGLALVIWQHSRRLGIAAFFWAAVTVLPRIYLGLHWPSDILAGALLGMIAVLLFRWIIPLKATNLILRYEKTAPAIFYACAFIFCYQLGTLFDDTRALGHEFKHAVLLLWGKL